VLTRIASSHLRVGSFQYAASAFGPEVVGKIADHAIARHYPAAAEASEPYLALLQAVIGAQAELIARWMLVGFVHGVMNTDNMTISGETIDYGPCAFMDVFDPATVFSSIDSWGRYAYGNQPAIAEWNLARFAETLLPLLADDQEQAIEIATAALGTFRVRYNTAWITGMRAKLGFPQSVSDDTAHTLVTDLLGLLQRNRVDYTSFFRSLAHAARGDAEPARGLFAELAGFDTWLTAWRSTHPDGATMDRANPVYIPRNHLVEEALSAGADGDLAPLRVLSDVLADPFTERDGLERYAEPPPDDFGDYRTFCGT